MTRRAVYHRSRRSGFTLFELLVSTALILVLLGGVWTLLDIFTAMETRGRRDTARARLTRGLYTQLQDDISQATQRTPVKGSKSASTVSFAKAVNTKQQPNNSSNNSGSSKSDPGDNASNSDAPNDNASNSGGDDAPEPDAADSLELTENLGQSENEETQAADDSSTTPGFGDISNTNSRPPEYAMLVGSSSWMILDLPIQPGDEQPRSPNEQLNSTANGFGDSSSNNWVATPSRHRVIYQFVAPEDQLADENLTLGLTRWQIDWQLASVGDLTEELNDDLFGSAKSLIWQRPQGSGAGSALSFITANTPQIEREEIPELKRILFRYYSPNDGWRSSWNSTTNGLPAAVQMRVLWHDVRKPIGDDAPVDRLGRPIAESFSLQDAKEEMELLAEWDEDNDTTYGFSSTATLTPPPPGYAEYLFVIPSMSQPVRSQIGNPFGGVQ